MGASVLIPNLVILAVAMLLARTGVLAARARRIGSGRADQAAAPVASLR